MLKQIFEVFKEQDCKLVVRLGLKNLPVFNKIMSDLNLTVQYEHGETTSIAVIRCDYKKYLKMMGELQKNNLNLTEDEWKCIDQLIEWKKE